MSKFVKTIAKKLIGNNLLLHHVVGRERARGKKITAAALMLYLLPVKKFIHISEYLKHYKLTIDNNYYDELHNLLHVAKVNDYELVRVGRDHDGGYIMLDDFGGGYAYSFGICDDVSWDKDIASRGYEVFMYDHTIENLPEQNPRFHFFKQGIADGKNNDDKLKSLEHFIKVNKHENEHNMILKMDVEGAEWGFLSEVDSEILKQFDQIVLEFHDLNNPRDKDETLAALRKLKQTHEPIHIHANNNEDYHIHSGKIFADVIEVSYVRREKYNLTYDYDVNLPLDCDQVCNVLYPEIKLGRWNEPLILTEDSEEIVINALRNI